MGTFSVPRYAVYFVPPVDSALYRFGTAVLGYDAAAGVEVPQLVPEGFDLATWRALTVEPRAYGFHATIKAPLRLAEGKTEESLIAAFNDIAAALEPFKLPILQTTPIDAREGEGAFIALMEPGLTPALEALENEVMLSLDPFRAALTDKEYVRRRPEKLTDRQRYYLNAYGYPYVLEDFRFHMTLTSRVPEEQVDMAIKGLARLFNEQVGSTGVLVDSLALYKQEAGASRFKQLARAPFRSSAKG